MGKEFVIFMLKVNFWIFFWRECPQLLCGVHVTGGASLMLSGTRIFQPAHAQSGFYIAHPPADRA